MSITPHRRQLLALGALALTPWAAHANWPQRPVRIVVPFAPGAGTDAMGRLLAQKLGELLGATFVVENRAGASGAIGTQHVAQSAPDGHTLLLIAAPFTTVAAVLPQAGYDPVRGFAPISMVAQGPLLWACHKDLPVANLRELIDYARSRPGRLNYGSAGAGGINHLALEGLKARTGVFITHIPYRGIAPATLDLVAGQLDLITGTLPALAPFVRDGRIKALAVTTPKRTPALPDVPGMSEVGLADFSVNNYFGLVAPRGTPQAVIDRLNESISKIVGAADVKQGWSKQGAVPMVMNPAAFTKYLNDDIAKWAGVIKTANIKLD